MAKEGHGGQGRTWRPRKDMMAKEQNGSDKHGEGKRQNVVQEHLGMTNAKRGDHKTCQKNYK
jgi:hypothetical protein